MNKLNKLEKDLKNVRLKLTEQKNIYETAQYMLMREVIKYIDEKDYFHLKEFCETYANKNK